MNYFIAARVGGSVSALGSSIAPSPESVSSPIVHSISRWYDRRLPIHDIILNRVLHDLLVVQREDQLHDVLQFGLELGVRSPEKEAQTSELPLEFLIPGHQYETEHVIDGVLLHNCRRRKHWLASLSPELLWDVGNHVIYVALERDIRRFNYSKDRKKVYQDLESADQPAELHDSN